MKLHALSLAFGALLALSSCSIQNNTHVQRSRMDNYSKLYAERPRTILLMPVVNKGGGAQLDQPLLQASVRALSEQGYYVISPRVVSALVGAGGLEFYRTMEPHYLVELFGADAALYTTILDWQQNRGQGETRINIGYELRSLRSGETLINRRVSGVIDDSVVDFRDESVGTHIFQFFFNALTSLFRSPRHAIDRVQDFGIGELPYGPYHKRHYVDMKEREREP